MPELQTNVLYYGDYLDILRRYVPDESVILSPYQHAERITDRKAAEQRGMFDNNAG